MSADETENIPADILENISAVVHREFPPADIHLKFVQVMEANHCWYLKDDHLQMKMFTIK